MKKFQENSSAVTDSLKKNKKLKISDFFKKLKISDFFKKLILIGFFKKKII